MAEFHPLVKLARETIERYIRDGIHIDLPQELTPEMQRRAGAFVTVHRHDQLRGCIGTIQPVCDNVAEEVIRNAVLAVTQDPRFPRVRRDELEDLDVKVDVLGEPEPVHSLDELDPRRYGLIVQSKDHPLKRGEINERRRGHDQHRKETGPAPHGPAERRQRARKAP